MLFADDFPWAVLFDDLKIVAVAAISLGTLYLQWRMRADLKANTKETVLSKNAAIGAANIGMDNREMLAEQKEALVPAAAKAAAAIEQIRKGTNGLVDRIEELATQKGFDAGVKSEQDKDPPPKPHGVQ